MLKEIGTIWIVSIYVRVVDTKVITIYFLLGARRTNWAINITEGLPSLVISFLEKDYRHLFLVNDFNQVSSNYNNCWFKISRMFGPNVFYFLQHIREGLA